jgi:hypothetical protein
MNDGGQGNVSYVDIQMKIIKPRATFESLDVFEREIFGSQPFAESSSVSHPPLVLLCALGMSF